MKWIGMVLSLPLLITMATTANADDSFLMDSCAVSGRNSRYGWEGSGERGVVVEFVAAGGIYGLSCRQLIHLEDSAVILGATVIAMSKLALRNPEIAALLATDATTAGLSMANPVVLAVSLTGTLVAGVVYIVIKRSVQECRTAAAEERILLEIERRTGAKIVNPVKIRFDD